METTATSRIANNAIMAVCNLEKNPEFAWQCLLEVAKEFGLKGAIESCECMMALGLSTTDIENAYEDARDYKAHDETKPGYWNKHKPAKQEITTGKETHLCEEMISMQWQGSCQCEFVASVERDGKWYCKKHDPTPDKSEGKVE